MKKGILTILIAASMLSSQGNAGGEEKYSFSKGISSVEWTGKKVTGQHEGTVGIKSADFMVEDGALKSGMVVMDMESIAVTDIENAGTNAKLKGHLMSDDFFGVKDHPTATLDIQSVVKKEKNIHMIKAELTLKGKKEMLEFPATVIFAKGKLVAIGEMKIDRTKFNIKYGSGKFFEDLGDKMIDDEFSIKFKVGAQP